MAHTITTTATRVTVSGAYKAFTGTSTLTIVTRTAGESPAVGDVGRFILWCRGGTTNTGPWEVRRIIAATTTTVTVHDPWGATPSSGDTFRISTTMDDILTAQPSIGTKTGDSQFLINRDLQLSNTAFLGSADEAVEWKFAQVNPAMPMDVNTVLQLGQLWGGEGVGTQTTNGSRWFLNGTSSVGASVYASTDARNASGWVVNYYGSLIESKVVGGYFFQRMNGPVRFIGSTFDGVMGGRFYHESSEWVQCRMSGNDNATPAWSLGATFTRAIDSVSFYRNLVAMKNYQSFSGVLRNVTLANNGTILSRGATVDSVFQFIDCTEFGISEVTGTTGIIHQDRSINIATTDDSGIALDGISFRVNNNADATQGSVAVSSGGGLLPETYARRFTMTNGTSDNLSFAPFRIRYRGYGYLWQEISAAVADPIKQGVAMLADANVSQSSAVALAHTGISVADTAPVSWNGKNFRITVTGNLTTNPGLTIDDIKHYLHYYLAQTAAFGGKASGLDWHNLIPMAGLETERGNYAGTYKGVRIIDQAGNAFVGTTRFQSDDGTYYTVPVSKIGSVSLSQAGSRVQVYNVTKATEIVNQIVAGTTLNLSTQTGVGEDWSIGDVLRIRATYCNGLSAAQKVTSNTTIGASQEWSVSLDQPACTVYAAYGIDGSAVTEFSWDGANVEFDINDPDNIWYVSRLFAWDKYFTFTEAGIRESFAYIGAIDAGNIQLDNTAKLDNLKTVSAIQGDNVRIFHPDGSLPVVNPTTGGGGLSFYGTGTIFTVATGSAVTSQDKTDIINGVWGTLIESGMTAQQANRIMLAAMAGKLSGASGTSIAIRDINDTKNRIQATVDTDGNRSAVVLDGN